MAKPGEPFIELLSIDSTNIYAMQQVHARLATPGTAYFAHEQTQGKGQRNKQWQTEQGQNLIISVVISPPHMDPAINFPLSAATALACYDFFSRYAGDETFIKWPNDLYWRDRKAGGILIENAIRGGVWEYAVIGTGININQTRFDPAILNPVSLKQITGKTYDVIALAKELCSCLETRLDQLGKGAFLPLLEEYNQVLFGKKEDRRFRHGTENFHGRVRSVTEGGELEIENGDLRTFRFGEIEWVMDN